MGDDEAADETRRSILSRALRSQWQALLDWLRRGRPAKTRASSLDGEEASRRIRGLYQRFLAAMIERERRPPGATPDGYCAAVAPATPEQAVALERLTAAYVAVRYGASAPDDAAVADADAAAGDRAQPAGRRRAAPDASSKPPESSPLTLFLQPPRAHRCTIAPDRKGTTAETGHRPQRGHCMAGGYPHPIPAGA